jgi:hypothetical protein
MSDFGRFKHYNDLLLLHVWIVGAALEFVLDAQHRLG